ncbi:MAG: hypothetical protein U9O65_08560 [Thermotogota bacterium]|nr:hypothetical protein [Thermotogota bacterium]
MKVSAPIIETERGATLTEISCDNASATAVINYNQGKQINGGSILTVREDPNNATGEVDGIFFSPGFFSPLGDATDQLNRGWVILDFGQMVGDCINVLETSPAVEDNYPLEQAEVWVNDDLLDDWVYLGIAQNNQDPSIATPTWPAHPNVFTLDECIRYVKIIDITDPGQWPSSSTADGFDVDAVYAGECIINVPLDIKPTSCPNPLNTKSNGVIPVAILGTVEFDVNDIDPATVLLEGVAPLRWAYEDVATPFELYIGKTDCDNDCNILGPDGYTDLTLKFDTQELLGKIGTTTVEITDAEVTASELKDGDCLVLELTGNLFDGTPIYGEDVVKILDKGK